MSRHTSGLMPGIQTLTYRAFEDLRNHSANQDKSYFYGTILLSKARDVRRRHLTAYDLVDGQQRLTTACIFAAAAISLLNKNSEYSQMADLYRETFIDVKLRPDGLIERIVVECDFDHWDAHAEFAIRKASLRDDGQRGIPNSIAVKAPAAAS